jgi:hypothetical protein
MHLKKLILITLLALPTIAVGEWTQFWTGDSTNSSYYFDVERIKKIDNYIYYWALEDKPTGSSNSSYLSAVTYYELDCKFNRERGVQVNFYSGHMSTGDLDNYSPPLEWRYASPNSIREFKIDLICSSNY